MSWLTRHDPPIRLHSGGLSHYKVNAGDLYADPAVRDAVFACWAAYLDAHSISRFLLVPIPTGGVAWAEGFRQHLLDNSPTYSMGDQPVIVDDVLTTGASIRDMRQELGDPHAPALVVVNRGASFWQTCEWMYANLPMVAEA